MQTVLASAKDNVHAASLNTLNKFAFESKLNVDFSRGYPLIIGQIIEAR